MISRRPLVCVRHRCNPDVMEASVRIFALRVLTLAVLVLLYQLSGVAGVAALLSGFGYVLLARREGHGRERQLSTVRE